MMTDLLAYIGPVVGAWTTMAVVFLGVGVSVRRAFGLRQYGARQLLILPLIGWCIAVAFLQIWHFFLPVDQRALVVVAVAGMVGLAWNWRDLWNVVTRSAWNSAIVVATFLLVAIWLANQTTNQPQNYDSGLYHLNAVRWAHSYPL
ncbi:MAG: hypothetical protein WCN95_01240, partial [bacterium]